MLVLESSEVTEKDSFVKKVKPFAEIVSFSVEKRSNVFDMTRAMSYKKPADALKILSGLISEGSHPLQIMGGLVWFWGKAGQRIGMQKYEKGLRALQDADLDIKRSRLKPDYAMEVLVVKLCTLLQ